MNKNGEFDSMISVNETRSMARSLLSPYLKVVNTNKKPVTIEQFHNPGTLLSHGLQIYQLELTPLLAISSLTSLYESR